MHEDLQKETLKQLMKGKDVNIILGINASKTLIRKMMLQRVEAAEVLNPSIKFGTLTIN